MSVRLRPTKSFRYRGAFEYLVTYDHSAGLPERYTVLILNVDDPVTVGRELPLSDVRPLIADYEKEAQGICFFGDRGAVLWAKDRVIAMRRKKYGSKKRVERKATEA